MPLHIPAGQAQVLIAVQAGGEPGVLQGLAGRQSLAWVGRQQLPHQALCTAKYEVFNCLLAKPPMAGVSELVRMLSGSQCLQ